MIGSADKLQNEVIYYLYYR